MGQVIQPPIRSILLISLLLHSTNFSDFANTLLAYSFFSVMTPEMQRASKLRQVATDRVGICATTRVREDKPCHRTP